MAATPQRANTSRARVPRQPTTTDEPLYASPGEVRAFAKDLPEEFLLCRDLGHSWRPHGAKPRPDGSYDRTLRCSRCTTERREVLNYRGHKLSGNYDHPEGYLAKGMGRIVGDGRDILRMESLIRIMIEE